MRDKLHQPSLSAYHILARVRFASDLYILVVYRLRANHLKISNVIAAKSRMVCIYSGAVYARKGVDESG